MADIKEFRDLSDEQLQEKLKALREEFMKLRFQAKGAPLKNPFEKRNKRRDIARVMTLINERKQQSGKTRQ